MSLTAEFERRYRLRTKLLRAARNLGFSNLVHWMHFLVRHRRWPNFGKTRYLNDYLFELKTGSKLSVLQEFTSDKEFMKVFVRGVLGETFCVPTLAVLRSPDEVDALRISQHSMVKPTHMSGQWFPLKRDPRPDEIALMKKWLRTNYSDYTLEPNYRNLERKIIVEPFIDFLENQRVDYKIYCHDKKARMIALTRAASTPRQFSYFTPDWKQTGLFLSHLKFKADNMPRPDNLNEMIEAAEKLAAYFDAVRVDLYSDGKSRILVGELTHLAGNAGAALRPVNMERYFVDGAPDCEKPL